MGKILMLFALAAFALASFAADCEPGYTETAIVQALDGRGRGIENASIQITYQVDQTTGQGYAITFPKMTDSNGVATITFQNKEVLKSRVDCEYTVSVAYDNKKAERKVTVGAHPVVIQLQLDVYRLNLQAVDQHGNVLPGAVLSVRGFSKTAGNDGRATLLVGSGLANVTLRYGEGTVSRSIAIENDTDFYYQAGVYDLNIYIVDDTNAPLVADAQIGSKTVRTDAGGFASVKKLLTARPEIKAVYRGIERVVDADLDVQQDYYIVYDLHAPKISGLGARYENGDMLLNMSVSDAGVRASGLAPDGITVTYSFGGSDYAAPVYVKAREKYEALLSNIDHNGVIELSVEAKDNEGNIRSVKGYFSIEFINETAGGNETGGGGGGSGFSIEPVHIVAIGAVLIVLLFAAKYIREKLAEP